MLLPQAKTNNTTHNDTKFSLAQLSSRMWRVGGKVLQGWVLQGIPAMNTLMGTCETFLPSSIASQRGVVREPSKTAQEYTGGFQDCEGVLQMN